MKKKIREGFISASYKKSVRVVCSIIAFALAVVLLIFKLYAIFWVPVILLTFTKAIKDTDREVVEKNKLFLVILSYDDIWYFTMLCLIYTICYEFVCFNIITYIIFLLFIIAMYIFVIPRISGFFKKKLIR